MRVACRREGDSRMRDDSGNGNGMNRRRLIVNGLAAGAAATLLTGAGEMQAAASLRPPRVFRGRVRNVVMIHGAYADGSCWSEVIERLQAAGVTATAVQNPLSSLADDVAATRLILARHAEPTILVGHSYGGARDTQAGGGPPPPGPGLDPSAGPKSRAGE